MLVSTLRIIRLSVNGRTIDVPVQAGDSLLDVLRDRLGFTGPKKGCGSGDCGACTVTVNQKAVCSCIYPAIHAEGKEVVTIEGLAAEGTLHPLQDAFIRNGAAQCGFCIPGMLMASKAFLDENEEPSEEAIRAAISGNLCRCTGYAKIVKSVQEAAQQLRGQRSVSRRI